VAPELIGIVVAAMFGGGGLAAVYTALQSRKTVDADAMQTWSKVWNENLNELRREVGKLRERVNVLEAELTVAEERNRILTTVLIENRIAVPPK
jgi:cell division protein FtsB